MDGSNPQFRVVLIEVLRRTVVLALFIASALYGFGYGHTYLALGGVAAGILIYSLVPRPVVPRGAMHHERLPSTYMPDLLGFMLATLFLALPLIVAVHDPWLEGPWALYLLTGLPGLVSLLIFHISIRHQIMWLKVSGHDMAFADFGGITEIGFDAIASVRAEVKPPPRWLKPLLALFGGWRGLGIALVTDRASHNLVIERLDGSHLRLPVDAFPDLRKVVLAMHRGGVRLDGELEHAVAPRHRRRKPVHGKKGKDPHPVT